MKNLAVDTGFLVALWRRADQHHQWAVAAAKAYPPPWLTCESVLSEAEHLLGPAGRASLRTACRRGALKVVPILADETAAVLDLLDKYHDVPMSLADAAMVRIAEVFTDPLILSTDADFKVYRRHGRKVIPCILP